MFYLPIIPPKPSWSDLKTRSLSKEIISLLFFNLFFARKAINAYILPKPKNDEIAIAGFIEMIAPKIETIIKMEPSILMIGSKI